MIKVLLFILNISVSPDVVMSKEGLDIAKDLREVTNAKLHITSNCRSKEVNASIGGKYNSMHLQCKALDIRIHGMKKSTIKEIKTLANKGKYDVIVEDNPPHIHIEVRE